MTKHPPGHTFNLEGDPHNPVPEDFIPKGCLYQEVFRIEKSENTNSIRYYAFYKPDAPNKIVDVGVFWYSPIANWEHHQLNWIERFAAYGIKIENKSEDSITFYVVSLNYVHVTVTFQNDKFVAKTTLNDKPVILKTIYVDVTTIILIKPVVHSVTAKGVTEDTNEEIEQVFYP